MYGRRGGRGVEGGADFAGKDLAEVGAADAALVHAGGVDVQEDFWRAVLQEVALEVGGDFEDEDVVAAVHGGVCFGAFDGDGRAEVGRADGVGKAAAEGRAVFVDDGDGGVTDVGVALRHGDDHAGEHVGDEEDEDGVGEQAAQLFADEGQEVAGHSALLFFEVEDGEGEDDEVVAAEDEMFAHEVGVAEAFDEGAGGEVGIPR